jgi:hypothetical protein
VRDREFSLSDDEWQAWVASRGRGDLNLLLFALWDPIGVSETAITAGEYESYIDDVVAYGPVTEVPVAGAVPHAGRLPGRPMRRVARARPRARRA